MKDFLEKLYFPNKLKEVDRFSTVNSKRFESGAEHVYSSALLVTYLLKKISSNKVYNFKLDEAKVLKMILYHDLLEIKNGDTFILDDENKKLEKEEFENKKNISDFSKNLMGELQNDFVELFNEFFENKTYEARLVNAVDAIDPMIQDIFNKEEWLKYNFTEEKLRTRKESAVSFFSETKELFELLIKYCRENGYFQQED